MPKQLEKWKEFDAHVSAHITEYVVPQYGDDGEDPATEYDAGDCIKQAQKYLARFGRSSRPGEETRDLAKAAHWIQKAYGKVTTDGEH